MNIEWNKVTWYSKLAAVILGMLILLLGFYIGQQYQMTKAEQKATQQTAAQKDEELKLGPQTGFKQEGDDWVLYDYEGKKLGLTVPVQKDPYYNPYPDLKYLDLPLSYKICNDEVAYLAKNDPVGLDQEYLHIANTNGTNNRVQNSQVVDVSPPKKYPQTHGVFILSLKSCILRVPK
jgi:hypothetical protein